jgi:RNA polymerase sigma-70 factor (ECF subfamily)
MSGQIGNIPDEALAAKARDGDRSAFETLIDRYLPVVYNRLRARLPPEAVEDVTQQVFVAAVRGIERFRGEASFRTWLIAIARHKVADYYRRRQREPETVPFDGQVLGETPNPGSRDDWEEQVLVRVCLRWLPSHYREILLMRFAEGLKFRTIAEILDISLDAAKSRYRRAVAALAEEMRRGT